MVKRQTALSAQITAFGRHLREKNFAISPERIVLALEALTFSSFEPDEFKYTLKAVFPQNKEQRERFDALFDAYFRELNKAVDAKIKEDKKPVKKKKSAEASFKSLKNWLNGNPKNEEELSAYGGKEAIKDKDFKTYNEEDILAYQKELRLLIRKIKSRPGRRKIETKRNAQPDLASTFRKNIRSGTEIKKLFFRKQKPNPLRLVMLTDVSRSMELYSRFFVQFMYAFKQVYSKIETYVFSSDLYHISEELKTKDFERVLSELDQKVVNWSGGTEIGHSLKTFISSGVHQKLDKKTIVFIVSDGLGMNDGEAVADAMREIKKRAKKIIWVNPLAGNPNYEPKTESILAAWPYIDLFTSGHSLQRLREVILQLNKRIESPRKK